ncbi:hypothetical protein [Synechococcus sp. PCC 7336]|uniref:hypothetical protein n=1 Tax=Synechococcus sp. PCC 7336 TaxID=195250 RepID=UPI000345405C|nr:hypothetical protein [Synechococcus sp. PCC 7336]
MKGLLMADTVPGTAGTEAIAAPVAVSKAIAAYLTKHRHSQLQGLSVPEDLAIADWGQLWRDYTELLERGEPLAIALPHSFGAAIDATSTLAEWAGDWRLSVLLTLPINAHSFSLATAFAALARQSQAQLLGFVVWGSGSAEAVKALSEPIEATLRVPVLGHLDLQPQDLENPDALATAAAQLNWELLPW